MTIIDRAGAALEDKGQDELAARLSELLQARIDGFRSAAATP